MQEVCPVEQIFKIGTKSMAEFLVDFITSGRLEKINTLSFKKC